MFGKPFSFKARIEPRTPARAALIKKTFAEAKTDVLSLADASNNGSLGDMQHLVDILESDPEATKH